MRTKLIVLALSLFVVGIAADLHAQGPDQLIIDVPFSFVANGATLPAGTYRVSRASIEQVNTLLIRNLDGSRSAFIPTSYVGTPGSKLVFDVVGGEHYLRAVSTATGRHELAASRAELQAKAANTMTMNSSAGK